jgi:Asp-tRNA(Asn)/Glu-tRNA(Gln) amidotransferase A subunit family amidase
MDTNAPKTPATLPFAAWQSMSSRDAARTVHARIAALPENFRRAALAWVRPEAGLEAELSYRPARGPVSGVPYLLKDLFNLAGVPTNAGSTFLNQVRGTPTRDSVIAWVMSGLGAPCVGKTQLVEFAAGLFGDNAHYGDCPHPHDPTRLSGGSSSGSASLVGAGVVPLAIGTDTGGSVRVPAAFCGVYGFRLSPHDDLIRDAMPLSPTLDTAGWFTAHADDMVTAWEVLAVGTMKHPAEPQRYSRTRSDDASYLPSGCFLPAKELGIAFDPDTAKACDQAAAALAKPADANTSAALLGSWRDAIEAYTITALHEAHVIHRNWLAPYREHYEPSIWQRFSDGGHYSPQQLAKAAATFERVRTAFAQYFKVYDYLVLPATPFPALRKADCTPEARKALLTLTTPASLAGLPVLTIPVALPSSLTTGLQVILPAADSPVVPHLLEVQ